MHLLFFFDARDFNDDPKKYRIAYDSIVIKLLTASW